MTQRIFFFSVLFFVTLLSKGQYFDSSIEKTSLAIGGQTREGYLTRFDLSAKKLEKEWWKYCREFGRPLNMKGYYQVTIPAELNDGNVDLVLLSKSMSNKNGSAFFLTLDDASIPKAKVASYLPQVKGIMQSFKINYAVDILEEKLQQLEKKAANESKKVDKSSGSAKQKHLINLQSLGEEIDEVKQKLVEINNAY